MLANDILHTIGSTPHIRINRLFGNGHTVYIKSERSNPGGSIKDRIALSMIEAAEAAGQLKPGYSTIVGLYQALGAGIDGGIAITVAELALLPNLVVWAAAWLLGPGFALGAGTTVSPSVTLMGPVPGIPVLGALPAEGAPLGVLWLALPVLLGFGGAVLVAASAPERRDEPWWATLAVGLGAGGIAGLVLGGLAAFSGGAAGPGRLAVVGPDAFLVAAAAAASVGVGAVAGAFAARSRVQHGDVSAPGDPRAMRDDGLGDRDRRDAAPADRDGSDTEVLDDARLPR